MYPISTITVIYNERHLESERYKIAAFSNFPQWHEISLSSEAEDVPD